MSKTVVLNRLSSEQIQTRQKVLSQVVEFTIHSLSSRALQYCLQRGISQNSIIQWQLGYFPRDMQELFARVNPRALREQGLVYSAQNSPLQRRLTFPIFDQYNDIVAIAGRPPINEDDRKRIGFEPKYWHNSFDKGRILYGLHTAIPFIRAQNLVYVVEGQFDVIVGHQHGIQNLVCPCGTSFTDEHIRLLARYASRVVVIFDGDTAGRAAAQKVQQRDLVDLDISTIHLPTGSDFDLYLREHGVDAFYKLIKEKDFADNIIDKL